LYTVRDDCQKDFKGTLKALAGMGYQGVEMAGNTGGMSPRELARFLHSLDLHAIGQHCGLEDILNPRSEIYACARALNAAFVTTSLCGEVGKNWPATIDRMVQAAAVAYSQGCVFTYHNHAQEMGLLNGVIAEDLVLARHSLVQFEMDTYWIRRGGQDPVNIIRRYAGRAPEIHLKDMNPADQDFTEVGRGNMDLPGILAAAEECGARWIIVEQDTCKRPALESARISIDSLKKLGKA
jgi:sugar phosphate isomerase/epimerase